MNISSVKLVYFSPTGTTRKILEGIASGTGIEAIEHINMTLPEEAEKTISSFTDELVVIGAPVYAGRLPADAVKRLQHCKGKRTPAILVVVYGNRAYEDALLELVNVSTERGFIPVSGGAFIGEHSFSTQELPIANERPDTQDMEKAAAFGAAVMQKLSDIQTLDDISSLKVPGNFPYKDGPAFPPLSPSTREDICTVCGVCADVCPTAAITVNDAVRTDASRCIKCCACIKECPENARVMDDEGLKGIAKWLHENFSQRKEPEWFV